eukprot:3240213-Pleurochrysis_carterae.AAC.1
MYAPMPLSGSCRAPNPLKTCACPAVNAPKAMAKASRPHVIVELFDCVPFAACVGASVKCANVSGIVDCEVSRRCDESRQCFGSSAVSMFDFAMVATGLAGAEAGCGLAAGAGVCVIVSRLSLVLRRRCSRT